MFCRPCRGDPAAPSLTLRAPPGLLLAEHQVHDPAAADVRPLAPAVAEDLLVGAAGVHQGVGQEGQAVEGPVLVDAAGQADGVGGPPAGVEGDGAEGVAENCPRTSRSSPRRTAGSPPAYADPAGHPAASTSRRGQEIRDVQSTQPGGRRPPTSSGLPGSGPGEVLPAGIGPGRRPLPLAGSVRPSASRSRSTADRCRVGRADPRRRGTAETTRTAAVSGRSPCPETFTQGPQARHASHSASVIAHSQSGPHPEGYPLPRLHGSCQGRSLHRGGAS